MIPGDIPNKSLPICSKEAWLESNLCRPSLVPPSCSEERGQGRGRRAACCKHLARHTWAQPVLAAVINQPFQRWRRREALSQSQPEVLPKAPEGKEGSRVLLRGSTSAQSPPNPTSQTTVSAWGSPVSSPVRAGLSGSTRHPPSA